MAELGAAWGATVKAALSGAIQPLAEQPPGLPERVVLAELTLHATYTHELRKETTEGGTIAIAVGPAQIGGTVSSIRSVTDTGNLEITARYETRAKADG